MTRIQESSWAESVSHVLVADDGEAPYELVMERGWGDGLPIVVPTEARVAAMIEGANRDPLEVIGVLPPSGRMARIADIAINAVLAGCRPEYMPVVVAAVKAVTEPDYNLLGVQDTTNPVTPLVVVHGPVCDRLDINYGRGALGPGWRANATIGRALRLVMRNVGGAIPGGSDKSVQAQPGKYTFCVGEAPARFDEWPTLLSARVPTGVENAVTVFAVTSNVHSSTMYDTAESIVSTIADAMSFHGANNAHLGYGNPVVIFTTGHQRLFQRQGWSKQAVRDALYEQSRIHIDRFPAETSNTNFENRLVRVGDWVYIARRPEELMVLVSGADEAYHATYCPGWDCLAITVPIEPAS